MATVYLAQDLKHDRKVALKVLKPELAAVLGAERFVVEIKTTASLQHPHILPLFDSGTADGFLFYVMPFIEGETLRDKLNRETQLGVDEAVRIAREVADALEYAHSKGVIHRRTGSKVRGHSPMHCRLRRSCIARVQRCPPSSTARRARGIVSR
jgi:serine/threonine-protein kinase